MDGISPLSWFLAANTAAGFYSVYEDLAQPEKGDKVWYIKGGPGNGKSTFMRRAAAAAESAGYHVEYILCSGDPASLDGIYIRELKCAYVDSTAPHIQEPALPGISGRYLDMSQFYKHTDRLNRDEITELFRSYRKQYARAYDLLAAAGKADACVLQSLISVTEQEDLFSEGRDHLIKILPPGDGGGTKRRFISANSCLGFLSLPGSAYANGKVYLLPDALAHSWLSGAAQACREKGHEAVLCLDPLVPEKLDGLIVPTAGISFLKVHAGVRYPTKNTRRLFPKTHVCGNSELKQAKRLQNALLKEAYSLLTSAKRIHDALEAIYRPAVDFRAVDRFTEKHIREHISAKQIGG